VTRAFIELYMDEDVDVVVADLIRARGFSVTTTRDAGQLGNTDAEQLAYAAREQKALVTHNRRHFESLARTYLAEGRPHSGIILATRHPSYEIARRLLLILNNVTAAELRYQVRYI
jgi:predicted nuclease of predicted toxin-antitoxin system